MKRLQLILLLISLSFLAFNQEKQAHGYVITQLNKVPLGNAVIGIKDTNLQVFTDSTGHFQITVPRGSHYIFAMKEGYALRQIKLKPLYWSKKITIKMAEDRRTPLQKQFVTAKSYCISISLLDGNTYKGSLCDCNDSAMMLAINKSCNAHVQQDIMKFKFAGISTVDLKPRFNVKGLVIGSSVGLLSGALIGMFINLNNGLLQGEGYPDLIWKGALVGFVPGAALGLTIDKVRHTRHEKFHIRINGNPGAVSKDLELLKLFAGS